MTITGYTYARDPDPDREFANRERARPTGPGTGGRCCSEPLASPWVVDTVAVNQMLGPVAVRHRERAWWEDIVNALRHAYAAGELCDTWTLGDLADAIADALWAEARRLTIATEELVTVPDAAVAAVARIRKQEPAP